MHTTPLWGERTLKPLLWGGSLVGRPAPAHLFREVNPSQWLP
jgi:hypothetical protein